MTPIITGIIVHFRFHIRCISIHKLLYFNFFSASFCTTFLSAGIATSISVHVFSFLFYYYYYYLRSQRLAVFQAALVLITKHFIFTVLPKIFLTICHVVYYASLRCASKYMTRAKTAVPSFCVICLALFRLRIILVVPYRQWAIGINLLALCLGLCLLLLLLFPVSFWFQRVIAVY